MAERRACRKRHSWQNTTQSLGSIDDVAKAIEYLVLDATFTTGQILTIDGGRTINKP